MSHSHNQLAAAFRLIREFKEGHFATGSEISAEALALLEVLRTDLIPNEMARSNNTGELLGRLAAEDSLWNRRAGDTVNSIYAAMASGNQDRAEQLREDFEHDCPSKWYRSVVSDAG